MLLFLSCVQPCATLWASACQASLSFTVSRSLLQLMSTKSMMLSNHLILCHLLFLLPSVFPSVGVFSIGGPKYWSFRISPSNEYSGLISFSIDWFNLLVFQGTLKSLLQRHCLKASILWCSAFFVVQLSHLYMTTGKNISLTLRTFVDKVMSLLLNTLSRFLIAFLPRSKHLLISWLICFNKGVGEVVCKKFRKHKLFMLKIFKMLKELFPNSFMDYFMVDSLVCPIYQKQSIFMKQNNWEFSYLKLC